MNITSVHRFVCSFCAIFDLSDIRQVKIRILHSINWLSIKVRLGKQIKEKKIVWYFFFSFYLKTAFFIYLFFFCLGVETISKKKKKRLICDGSKSLNMVFCGS